MTTEYNMADLPNDVRNAADVIARDGWCKGELISIEGQVCAFGAIAKSIQERLGQPIIAGIASHWITNEFETTWRQIALAVQREFNNLGLKQDTCYLADYNDLDANSAEEVQKVLGQIADRLEFPDA